jgi:hypothetical protein
MEALRTIVHSEQLASFIDLPVGLQNREVEVIVLPIAVPVTKSDTKTQQTEFKSQKGCLKQYANPDLQHLEEGAWERAAVEKYLEKNREYF